MYPAVLLLLLFAMAPSGVLRAQTQTESTHVDHPAVECRTVWTFPERLPLANSPRVGLVLSGGGSRGFAQIGVLRALEDAGIPIYAVVGTSIGGVVGGLYSAGYTASDLDSIVMSTDWQGLLAYGDESRRRDLPVDRRDGNDRSLLTLRLDGVAPQLPEAVSSGSRITRLLERLVWGALYSGRQNFDSLRYRFRAVATDLVAGRSVTLAHGNLALAMRASATIPLRFSPVRLDSMLLVDGGLLNNVPVDVARSLGCDIVVVVNTTTPLTNLDRLNDPLAVADQIVSVMMQSNVKDYLSRADFVITPNLGKASGWDFSAISGLIDSGEAEGARRTEELRELIASHRDSATWHDTLFVVQAADPGLLASIEPEGKEFAMSISRSHVVERVAWTPISWIDSAEVAGLLSPMVGLYPDADSIQCAGEHLLAMARQRGLAFVRITEVRFDTLGGTLRFYIDEGRINSISILGLDGCAPSLVEREIGFVPGDIFDAGVAEQSINKILATGYFTQARIDVRPRATGGVDLAFNLSERSTAVLRFLASVDNERYTQIGIEVAQENLFGLGTRLYGRVAGGLRDRLVESGISTGRIYGTYWSFGLVGYALLRNVFLYERTVDPIAGEIRRIGVGEYKELRIGGRLRLGRQIGSDALLTIEGRFERQGAAEVSINSTDDARWRSVSTIRFGGIYDTRDRIPYPSSGVLLDMSYETAQSIFGADQSFVKAHLVAEVYRSVSGGVIHPRLEIGIGDATLPLFEQFSLGGQHRMLGLREDEIRGRQLVLGGIDYRILLPVKIYFDAYVSFHYQVGAAWRRPSEVHLADLEHAIGFSIGLDTPIGPADFSIGQSFTLNRPDAPDNFAFVNKGPVVAYFSLGYRFQ